MLELARTFYSEGNLFKQSLSLLKGASNLLETRLITRIIKFQTENEVVQMDGGEDAAERESKKEKH